jgi:hypothetical protein
MFWIIVALCGPGATCPMVPQLSSIYATEAACDAGLTSVTNAGIGVTGYCKATDTVVLSARLGYPYWTDGIKR